jgi:hypothetical protein
MDLVRAKPKLKARAMPVELALGSVVALGRAT